jgi:hypothetical protein
VWFDLGPHSYGLPVHIDSFEIKLELSFMQFWLTGWEVIGLATNIDICTSKYWIFAALQGVKYMIDPFTLTSRGLWIV